MSKSAMEHTTSEHISAKKSCLWSYNVTKCLKKVTLWSVLAQDVRKAANFGRSVFQNDDSTIKNLLEISPIQIEVLNFKIFIYENRRDRSSTMGIKFWD